MMRRRVVLTLKRHACSLLATLFGYKPSFRRFAIEPDDVFIVSYPRSGNTWVRFLVGNLIASSPTTFANVDERVPDIYKTDIETLSRSQRPRYLKSHETVDSRYPTVIYVVRDPRDVLVSYYHYKMRLNRIPDGHSIAGFAKGFIKGSLDSFGSWADHVSGWLNSREGSSGFLLVRYEDLLEYPYRETERITDFLGISCSQARVRQAVEQASFSQMRQLEETHQQSWAEAQGARTDIPFVRAGTREQWKTVCPEEIVSEIETRWRYWLVKLGYLTDEHVQGEAALFDGDSSPAR